MQESFISTSINFEESKLLNNDPENVDIYMQCHCLNLTKLNSITL